MQGFFLITQSFRDLADIEKLLKFPFLTRVSLPVPWNSSIASVSEEYQIGPFPQLMTHNGRIEFA